MKMRSLWVGLVCATLISGGCPAVAENAGPPPVPGNNSTQSLNVNTAGVDELATLPGVGPALAKRIIEYRTANGPFSKPEDLLAVKGIGAKLLAKIKDRLVFSTPAGKR